MIHQHVMHLSLNTLPIEIVYRILYQFMSTIEFDCKFIWTLSGKRTIF